MKGTYKAFCTPGALQIALGKKVYIALGIEPLKGQLPEQSRALVRVISLTPEMKPTHASLSDIDGEAIIAAILPKKRDLRLTVELSRLPTITPSANPITGASYVVRASRAFLERIAGQEMYLPFIHGGTTLYFSPRDLSEDQLYMTDVYGNAYYAGLSEDSGCCVLQFNS